MASNDSKRALGEVLKKDSPKSGATSPSKSSPSNRPTPEGGNPSPSKNSPGNPPVIASQEILNRLNKTHRQRLLQTWGKRESATQGVREVCNYLKEQEKQQSPKPRNAGSKNKEKNETFQMIQYLKEKIPLCAGYSDVSLRSLLERGKRAAMQKMNSNKTRPPWDSSTTIKRSNTDSKLSRLPLKTYLMIQSYLSGDQLKNIEHMLTGCEDVAIKRKAPNQILKILPKGNAKKLRKTSPPGKKMAKRKNAIAKKFQRPASKITGTQSDHVSLAQRRTAKKFLGRKLYDDGLIKGYSLPVIPKMFERTHRIYNTRNLMKRESNEDEVKLQKSGKFSKKRKQKRKNVQKNVVEEAVKILTPKSKSVDDFFSYIGYRPAYSDDIIVNSAAPSVEDMAGLAGSMPSFDSTARGDYLMQVPGKLLEMFDSMSKTIRKTVSELPTENDPYSSGGVQRNLRKATSKDGKTQTAVRVAKKFLPAEITYATESDSDLIITDSMTTLASTDTETSYETGTDAEGDDKSEETSEQTTPCDLKPSQGTASQAKIMESNSRKRKALQPKEKDDRKLTDSEMSTPSSSSESLATGCGNNDGSDSAESLNTGKTPQPAVAKKKGASKVAAGNSKDAKKGKESGGKAKTNQQNSVSTPQPSSSSSSKASSSTSVSHNDAPSATRKPRGNAKKKDQLQGNVQLDTSTQKKPIQAKASPPPKGKGHSQKGAKPTSPLRQICRLNMHEFMVTDRYSTENDKLRVQSRVLLSEYFNCGKGRTLCEPTCCLPVLLEPNKVSTEEIKARYTQDHKHCKCCHEFHFRIASEAVRLGSIPGMDKYPPMKAVINLAKFLTVTPSLVEPPFRFKANDVPLEHRIVNKKTQGKGKGGQKGPQDRSGRNSGRAGAKAMESSSDEEVMALVEDKQVQTVPQKLRKNGGVNQGGVQNSREQGRAQNSASQGTTQNSGSQGAAQNGGSPGKPQNTGNQAGAQNIGDFNFLHLGAMGPTIPQEELEYWQDITEQCLLEFARKAEDMKAGSSQASEHTPSPGGRSAQPPSPGAAGQGHVVREHMPNIPIITYAGKKQPPPTPTNAGMGPEIPPRRGPEVPPGKGPQLPPGEAPWLPPGMDPRMFPPGFDPRMVPGIEHLRQPRPGEDFMLYCTRVAEDMCANANLKDLINDYLSSDEARSAAGDTDAPHPGPAGQERRKMEEALMDMAKSMNSVLNNAGGSFYDGMAAALKMECKRRGHNVQLHDGPVNEFIAEVRSGNLRLGEDELSSNNNGASSSTPLDSPDESKDVRRSMEEACKAEGKKKGKKEHGQQAEGERKDAKEVDDKPKHESSDGSKKAESKDGQIIKPVKQGKDKDDGASQGEIQDNSKGKQKKTADKGKAAQSQGAGTEMLGEKKITTAETNQGQNGKGKTGEGQGAGRQMQEEKKYNAEAEQGQDGKQKKAKKEDGKTLKEHGAGKMKQRSAEDGEATGEHEEMSEQRNGNKGARGTGAIGGGGIRDDAKQAGDKGKDGKKGKDEESDDEDGRLQKKCSKGWKNDDSEQRSKKSSQRKQRADEESSRMRNMIGPLTAANAVADEENKSNVFTERWGHMVGSMRRETNADVDGAMADGAMADLPSHTEDELEQAAAAQQSKKKRKRRRKRNGPESPSCHRVGYCLDAEYDLSSIPVYKKGMYGDVLAAFMAELNLGLDELGASKKNDDQLYSREIPEGVEDIVEAAQAAAGSAFPSDTSPYSSSHGEESSSEASAASPPRSMSARETIEKFFTRYAGMSCIPNHHNVGSVRDLRSLLAREITTAACNFNQQSFLDTEVHTTLPHEVLEEMKKSFEHLQRSVRTLIRTRCATPEVLRKFIKSVMRATLRHLEAVQEKRLPNRVHITRLELETDPWIQEIRRRVNEQVGPPPWEQEEGPSTSGGAAGGGPTRSHGVSAVPQLETLEELLGEGSAEHSHRHGKSKKGRKRGGKKK